MKRSELTLNAIHLVIDYILLFAAALAAYSLRFGEAVAGFRPVVYEMPLKDYIVLALVFSALVVGTFSWLGLYNLRSYRRMRKEISRVFLGCTAVFMFVIVLIFLERDLFSSRFIILLTWVFSFFFVIVGRFLLRLLQDILFARGYGVNHLVVVGNDSNALEIINRITADSSFGYKVIQQFTDTNHDLLDRLNNLVIDQRIDEILQADPDAPKKDRLALLDFCNEHGIVFRYAADLFNTKATNVEVDTVAGIPIIEIKRTPLDGWGRISKRLFDIVASLLLLVVTAPIMLLVALAVKLDSKGPVFFSRLTDRTKVMRVGKNGQLFHYFKFRSMIDDAHRYRSDPKFLAQVQNLREGSPMMKFANDPRITRLGRFIRRFSIDEFPEFFLVFIGRMSLVGPRPHLPEEVERYKQHHRKALSIKPGITGLAQTSGRSDLSFEDEIRLDNYYIENWSLALDIIILLRTPLAMFKKRKAL